MAAAAIRAGGLQGHWIRTSALVIALTSILLAAGPAGAAIVTDPNDTRGPLDLVQVDLQQHVKSLSVRIRTEDELPRLRRLDRHPARAGKHPGRYLCVRFKSHPTGRRLLCPGGRLHHGRIDVGVSAVTKKGRVLPRGSIRARARKGGRMLSLEVGIRRLGLRPGRFSFGVDSAWPGCVHDSDRPHERRRGRCTDLAPSAGSTRERIYPLERSGCGGISESKVLNGSRAHREVALTFDDGPSAYTPEVLRILSDHDVPGTFFVIGEQVPSYSALVSRIVRTGNEVANHSLSHEEGPGYSSLQRTQGLIKGASGYEPCAFRPPYGYEPNSTYEAAQALGLVSVLWDVDTWDWQRPGAHAIYARATAVRPGSIVLMHDGGGDRSQTVAALPGIIENLRSRGYRLVTITRLMRGHYRYVEVHRHAGRRRPAPDLGSFPLHREGP